MNWEPDGCQAGYATMDGYAQHDGKRAVDVVVVSAAAVGIIVSAIVNFGATRSDRSQLTDLQPTRLRNNDVLSRQKRVIGQRAEKRERDREKEREDERIDS